MDVLGTIAFSLNWLAKSSTELAFVILKANYYSMTAVINGISFFVTATRNFLHSVIFILQCYVTDFLFFINELVLGLKFVLNVLITIVVKIFDSFFEILLSSYRTILTSFVTTHHAIFVVWDYICHVISLILYILNLAFSAVILILQLIPNFFLFIYYILLRCASYLSHLLHCLLLEICKSPYYLYDYAKTSSVIVMHNIPPKAFAGFIIVIFVYYKYKKIAKYAKYGMNLLLHIFQFALCKIFSYIRKIFIVLHHYILRPIINFRCGPINRDSAIAREPLLLQDSYIPSIPCGSRSNEMSNLQNSDNLEINNCINMSDSEQSIYLRNLEIKLHEEKDRQLCVVCQDQPRTILLLPCRHLCLCNDCWHSLQQSYGSCPVCRKYILDTLPVFV